MKVRVKKTGEVFLAMEFARVDVETYDSMGETRSYRLDEIEIIPDEPSQGNDKEVDWEQRRYEIAKDCLANAFPNISKITDVYEGKKHTAVWQAVDYADELIKQLKIF